MRARRSARRAVLAALVAVAVVLVAGMGASATSRADDPTLSCSSPTSEPSLAEPTANPRSRRPLCTHGPDDPLLQPALLAPAAGATTAAAAGDGSASGAASGIQCYGDGTTGQRVQAVYARASDQPDRFATVLPDIRAYAAQVDAEINASAAETGGERHVRWVTTGASPGCTLDVISVTLSAAGDDDFGQATVPELKALGYDRADRAYLIWMDASRYCGIGSLYPDDRHGPTNDNFTGPAWSRVDVPCWGQAETHELGHNLGAVQFSAPNTNHNGHCRDDHDLMCYDDGSPYKPYDPPPCADTAHERRFDCNHDDYFNTDPTPGSYLATSWNAADSPFLASTPSTGTEGLGAFHPVTPARVYDGRWSGIGRLATNAPHYVRLTGRAGIPAVGVGAVALNVTVTQPLAAGYVTIVSADEPAVLSVSTINFERGQTVANSAVVTVPFDGLVELFSSGGDPYVILDVAGWYGDASGNSTTLGAYHPLTPSRILDTRQGLGGSPGMPGGRLDLPVAGRGGVPPSGASSVVLNLTGVSPTAETYVTAWQAGALQPLASNINLLPGAVVPNQVVVPLGTGGRVSLVNAAGAIDLVADVTGWFDDGSGGAPGGVVYHPLLPSRVLDTRQPGQGGALLADSPRTLPLAGRGGIPASGVVAVAANLTVTGPTTFSYLTAWPHGQPMPLSSVLNYGPGQTVANMSLLTTGAGQADVINAFGAAHLVVDVTGWYG